METMITSLAAQGGAKPYCLRLSLRQSAIGTYCVGLDILWWRFSMHIKFLLGSPRGGGFKPPKPPPPPLDPPLPHYFWVGWLLIEMRTLFTCSLTLWTFFFFFLHVRKVCDVRWVPLLCVWKINWVKLSWKKVSEFPPPPPPLPRSSAFSGLARLSRVAAFFFFFLFSFFPCHRGLWCTMGTPNLCLENWAKNVESEKKCRDSPGWRRTEKNSVAPPPPPPPPMIRFGFAPLVSGRLNALLVSEH